MTFTQLELLLTTALLLPAFAGILLLVVMNGRHDLERERYAPLRHQEPDWWSEEAVTKP